MEIGRRWATGLVFTMADEELPTVSLLAVRSGSCRRGFEGSPEFAATRFRVI